MNYQQLLLQYGPLVGYLITFVVIFSETGLFFGFFLPGDSLLLPLGVLAGQGYFSLFIAFIVAAIAAVLGNAFGYVFGARVGERLFQRPDSRFFKRRYLEEARLFYRKHGKPTIFLARFVPFVRTFAPIVAGVGKMNYALFSLYNLISGLIWVGLILSVGYFLGNRIQNIDRYTLPLVGAIIIISLLPPVIHVGMQRRKNRKNHA